MRSIRITTSMAKLSGKGAQHARGVIGLDL